MKTLLKLSNHDLHLGVLSAVATERSATQNLLDYLAEVDRRRLFAERGFSSLWDYAVKELGLSEAQASDRIQTMRLSLKVPEVSEKIKDGSLSLTSAAKLARHVKREKLNAEATQLLLPQVSGKSSREVERVLVENSASPESARSPDRARLVTQEVTRLTLEVDVEFMNLFERMKELNGNPGASFQELFGVAMQEYVKRREIKDREIKEQEANEVVRAKKVQPVKSESPDVVPPATHSRYIPIGVRNSVRVRSEDRCEYVDSVSGRRCECKTGLEFDHYPIPFAMGGEHSLKNIRHACFAHNQLHANRTYGAEKMSHYL